MPISSLEPSGARVQMRSPLGETEIVSLAADRRVKILQTSEPIEHATWDLLNSELFTNRPDIELRVFGFHAKGPDCDLSFLARLPNVRRFSADCLLHARGVEHVAALGNLEELAIGIQSLESFKFLDRLPAEKLRTLSLEGTKSKKPDLAHLERFGQLRSLYLEGQQRNLDVISRLPLLEKLTLRSITVGDVNFLRGMKRLWWLAIKLGGTHNLAALEGSSGIKYLELWQIRGLQDISVVSSLPGLQFLFLQSLPHILAIPDLSELRLLRRVLLENMKGLTDISALLTAPALEELIHLSAQRTKPEQYFELLERRTLKQLFVGFGNLKRNEMLRDAAAVRGIKPWDGDKFVFV
jgi:hypothetical protein